MEQNEEIKDKVRKWEQLLDQQSVDLEFMEKDELMGSAAASSKDTMTTDQMIDHVSCFASSFHNTHSISLFPHRSSPYQ